MSPELWLPSLPDDGARWLALFLALVLAALLPSHLRRSPPRSLYVLAPLAAAALSAGYLFYYLRGGPRIIDATAYWLEARAFASGSFTLPSAGHEVMGRFLVRAPERAAVIFPPGYPAVLSLGFVCGVPLAVGPVIAALITLATMDLVGLLPVSSALRGPAVTFAALASVFCGALRYHTADTMAHGLSALYLTVAAAAALRARDGTRAPAVALGVVLGLLAATRPVTALAALVLVPFARRRLGHVAVAALPGLALWALYQHAATGSPFQVAQQIYYATSDGPPGCFRYGFGDVGCLGEHGDFVRARMPAGFGPLEALGTTGRRLLLHVGDGLGFAPAFALVVLGMRRAPLGVGLLPLALVVAYAPFYFDGNILGGGARMFADVLPVEHALAALGLARLKGVRFCPWATAMVVLSLAAFAFHQGAFHRQLAEREGGRPMFEAARVPPGMVFVATDHGFNLAYDPSGERAVARHHGDITDLLAWQARGRPVAWRYEHRWDGAPPRVVPMTFVADRLEGETLWPPLRQEGAWAWPIWTEGPCASGGRVLRIEPAPAGRVVLELPAALAGAALAPRVAMENSEQNHMLPPSGELVLRADGREVARWPIGLGGGCQTFEAVTVPEARALAIEVRSAVRVGLDVLLVRTTL